MSLDEKYSNFVVFYPFIFKIPYSKTGEEPSGAPMFPVPMKGGGGIFGHRNTKVPLQTRRIFSQMFKLYIFYLHARKARYHIIMSYFHAIFLQIGEKHKLLCFKPPWGAPQKQFLKPKQKLIWTPWTMRSC